MNTNYSAIQIHYAGTLNDVLVLKVDEPRVCASCSFTADSTARGCTLQLQNDEFTFVFNMSRQSSEELTLLECFPVPEAGVFSVSVYEIKHDGTLGHKVWGLPDIITGSNIDQTPMSTSINCGMILIDIINVSIIIIIINIIIQLMQTMQQ